MSSAAVASQNGTSSVPTAQSSTGKPSVQPTEVGWLFVPQYYTFLNNDPNKLHCFYTKKSTLVHGTEQEEAPLCFGQQQIHDKIVSIGFSDAKVYVSNVDSQASAAGGIIIQVLGEMSNAGGPWRKFAQTFFLAEQPNGYFVLNDIFRYLKEEGEAEEEAADVDEAIQNEVQDAEARGEEVVHQYEIKPQSVPDAVVADKVVEASTDNSVPATRVEDAQANGIVKPQEPTPAQPGEKGVSKKVTSAPANEVPPTKGEVEASEAATAPSNANAPNRAPVNGASSSSSSAAAAAPAAPAVPKTWANLAASNATKWGSTVSAEARGVSSARDNNPPPTSSKPVTTAASAAVQQQTAALKMQTSPASVFIKNVVVEQMPVQGLQAALEATFGPMKECQVVPSKACAFGEFASAEMAKKAIQKSQSEGGIKIGTNGWVVTIEEKRKPADRPQTSGAPRGGNRGGRGGARGAPSGRGARGS